MRRCRHCQSALCATQPDQRDFVRTLLTCTGCGRWYVRLAVPGDRPTVQSLPVPTLEKLGVDLAETDAA